MFKGDRVRFWDVKEERIRTGVVVKDLTPPGNMVRIRPTEWHEGYLHAYVDHVEQDLVPLLLEACKRLLHHVETDGKLSDGQPDPRIAKSIKLTQEAIELAK